MQCLLETPNLCSGLLREGFLKDAMPEMKLKDEQELPQGRGVGL